MKSLYYLSFWNRAAYNLNNTMNTIFMKKSNKNCWWFVYIFSDHLGRRIYWTDVTLQTIKSATFDGTDVHTIITFTTESSPYPYGIDVFGDLIYWTNHKDRSVFTAQKYTGNNMAPFLTDLDNPKHIKIISKESQKEGIGKTFRILGPQCSSNSYFISPLKLFWIRVSRTSLL